MKLSEIIDPQLVAQEVNGGYINCSAHPDDPSLKILCYSKVTSIIGRWNAATKQCRGLIIRSLSTDLTDAEVVARPWRKFFTLQQVQSGWALGDEEEGTTVEADIAELDFDAPAEVTDKEDGSLLVLYRHPDGLPAVSTKGSFESEQAVIYTSLLRHGQRYLETAERLLSEHPGTTFLFEGVGPSNQIVLAYPADEIIFLGAVNNQTGEYLSAKAFFEWDASGLKACTEIPAKNLGEAVRLADRQGKEGLVVRILSDCPENQMMIKVKQQDYMALHRLVTGFGEAAIRAAIMSSCVTFADLDKIAAAGTSLELPEVRRVVEFDNNPIFESARMRRREQFDAAIVPAAKAASRAKAYVAGLPEVDFTGDPREVKKRFAMGIEEAVAQVDASSAVLYVLASPPLIRLSISSPSLTACRLYYTVVL